MYNRLMNILSYPFRVRFVVALCALPLLVLLVTAVRSLIDWNLPELVASLIFGALIFVLTYFLYRGKAWARWFFIIVASFGVVTALLPLVTSSRGGFATGGFPDLVLSVIYHVVGIDLFRRFQHGYVYYSYTFATIVNASALVIGMFVVGCLVDWKAMQSRMKARADSAHRSAAHDKHTRLARLGAHVIDRLLMVFVVVIGVAFMGRSAGFDVFLMRILIPVAIVLIVQVVMIVRRSQTVGKYLMDLQVVDVRTGARISAPRYILIRGFVGSWLFGFAVLPAVNLYRLIDILYIFKDDERTLHDRIADTKVIKLS